MQILCPNKGTILIKDKLTKPEILKFAFVEKKKE
jgi:hypothetical protein